jgi:chorismate mutase / prephenate dehydratase
VTNDDPVVKQYRDQISDIDLELIALLNQRLQVVDQLWRYKAGHDIPMYVPEREAQMVAFLMEANQGPLSDDGLREVYRTIVETTKTEAARLTKS